MSRFYKVIYAIMWLLMKVLFPWKVTGQEHIPETGGVVLCGNHTSILDPLLVLLGATRKRQIHVIAKAELFRIPVLNWILKGIEMIPVKRGMSDVTAIKEGLRVLKNGEPLLIFPEGTRVKKGQQVEAHPGAVVLAARAGVPVLPVYICKKKRIFRKNEVVFGQPYQLEFAGRKPTHEESQRLTEELMMRIRDLGEKK